MTKSSTLAVSIAWMDYPAGGFPAQEQGSRFLTIGSFRDEDLGIALWATRARLGGPSRINLRAQRTGFSFCEERQILDNNVLDGFRIPAGVNGFTEIPLILAPVPVIAADAGLGLPAATAVRGGVPSRVTVTMRARPQVRLGQSAVLMLDSVSANAEPRAAATDPLVFVFPDSIAAGPHWVRLRVDGADSILLDRSGPAPIFDATQQITVPP